MEYEIINCSQLKDSYIGKVVEIYGWCRRIRDHGKKLFIDLADKFGSTQLVFESDIKTSADQLNKEFVIKAIGSVKKRDEDTVDKSNPTGYVEISVNNFEIINKSLQIPFELIDEKNKSLPNEELRLKYRYLDLRRQKMIKNIELRDKITKTIRKFFWNNNFLELETPTLVKDTYETGSRTFLVPSRIKKNAFYSLSQSPQIYKQLCMIGGLDKYFQIARCYRDEDQRIDRQPEFTQVDIEVSFKDETYIQNLIEQLISQIFKQTLNKEIKTPFIHLSYNEAMQKYGSDKPDLRFNNPIFDITTEMAKTDYKILKRIIENKGFVKSVAFNADYGLANSKINKQYLLKLIEQAKNLGLKGLTWLYVINNTIESEPHSISESIKNVHNELIEKMNLKNGDVILIGADLSENIVLDVLGKVRKIIGGELKQFKINTSFLWIDNFPLFEKDEITGKLKPAHNPFTAPTNNSIEYLDSNPELVVARQYDLVFNGEEIGGGSIRIHKPDLQKKVLKLIGMKDNAINDSFGFLINALSYGAPIHGGFAIGLDRFIALIDNNENIKDFILFPKNHKQELPVDSSPTQINKKRLLDDYNIKQEEIKEE
ncbi:aspartate--tRNA ligase [Candidatus Marsarchaeota archaeon]|nr:aspartate--tRNA ligase [Candidatus Marsarchaeota archaeon]